ncbi:MAG TPA: carboxypeptidase regulatory-like domain-containing protein [Candidatus Acidoferrales bacterium]|nr:carboxypeptidase regulatory-like domain-containing protein [Candidatus Acidoferrales bacterium]
MTAPLQTPDEATGQISGHIYRADTGEPLAKATVTLRLLQRPNPLVMRTGADGAFAFNQLEAGAYTLQAERSGFVTKVYGQEGPGRTTALNLSPAQNLNDLSLRLESASVISGNVTEEDGDPVEGIDVLAVRMSYQRGGREDAVVLHTTRTDDLGNFRLPGLLAGAYYLQVGGVAGGGRGGTNATYRRTYYPSASILRNAQPIQVAVGNEVSGLHLSVAVQTGYSISGTVRGAGPEEPLRYNVLVIPIGDAPSATGFPVAMTITRSDGSFSANGVPTGSYAVVARSLVRRASTGAISTGGAGLLTGQNDASTGIATVEVANADVAVNIEIGRVSAVRGQITVDGAQQAGSGGAAVALESLDGRRGGDTTSVAADGTFAIENIGPGNYRFIADGASYVKQATCAGADYTFQPLAIDSGTVLTDCKVLLGNDAGAFSGQVMDGNTPLPGLTVVAIPESRKLRRVPRYTLTGTTDGNGQFQIVGVIPGDYELFAVPEDEYHSYFALDFADRNQNSAQHASLKPGENQQITLKPAVPQ